MKPILCNYYVTYRCNAACNYCDIWKIDKFRQADDCLLDDVLEILPQLKSLGVKFIDFTGGEPLLHPYLPEMLHAAKKLKFYTSVTTNCLLYPQRADEIRGLVDLLHFSLDSLDEEKNDRIRSKGSYQKVMESLEIARRYHENPDLLFTATDQNYQEIDRLCQFAQRQKRILIVNPVFSYSGQKKISHLALDYLDRFKSKPYIYINRAFHRFIRSGGNHRKSPRCYSASSSIVISPQKELLLPCFHHQEAAIPIDRDLEQILASEKVEYFKQQQGRFGFCEGCTINCYFDPSFLYRIDEYFWLSLISKLKYGIDKYLRIKNSGD